MVGGADDALRLHPFDDPRRAVVADLQMALHKARRSLAFATYHGDGLGIERVARGAVLLAPQRVERGFVILGDLVDVVGLSARLQERDDALDLLVRDEGAVDTGDAATTRH